MNCFEMSSVIKERVPFLIERYQVETKGGEA